MGKHKAKRIQTGEHFTTSIYEYRGFKIRGDKPLYGWKGLGYVWEIEGVSKKNFSYLSQAKDYIDRLISKEA